MGVFAFNEQDDLLDYILFSKDPEDLMAKLDSDEDEVVLANRLVKKGYKVLTEARIEGWDHDRDHHGRKLLANRMFDLAIELKIHPTKDELQAHIRNVTMLLGRSRLEVTDAEKEQLAIQAVRTLDDVDKVIDRLGQRLREWFLARFPDFEGELPSPKDMVNDGPSSIYPWTTSELHRKNLGMIEKVLFAQETGETEEVGESGESDDTAKRGETDKSGTKVGSMEGLKALSQNISSLFEEREDLEDAIMASMSETAPNLTEVAGPVLSAKLISEAKSLRSLAMMATTTVQLLGAKRAVFRHLRSGDRPPKHGLVFIHPSISGGKPWQRGKIAKTLSSILVRAARADAFGARTGGHHLKKEYDRKLSRIQARMKDPPLKKKRSDLRSRPARGPHSRRGGSGRERSKPSFEKRRGPRKHWNAHNRSGAGPKGNKRPRKA